MQLISALDEMNMMLCSLTRRLPVNYVAIRTFYGKRSQVTPSLAEPSSLIPGKHPKWVVSGDEMFSELKDGKFKIYFTCHNRCKCFCSGRCWDSK